MTVHGAPAPFWTRGKDALCAELRCATAGLSAADAAERLLQYGSNTDDPVVIGLVDSLARPAGNLTGVAYLVGELSLKRLDLMLQAIPQGPGDRHARE